jgi:predicted nuclease of predicted toxin-antitoxin system
MIRLYLDENVQGAIRRGLLRRHVDVGSIQDDGLEGLADPEVLDRATALGRVLFSQDDDLLAEAARRQRSGTPFAGVIFAHQHVPIAVCIEGLELIAVAMQPEEFTDRVMYLPL